MTTKRSFTAIMTGTICLATCVFGLWQSSSAFAQCGSPQPSSCITCHAEKDPVIDRGEWHSAHASKDLCINCHGGNGSATDENLAHKDMLAQPLSDIYTNCHSCHPDYVERAVPYAATLRITPSTSSGLPARSPVAP